MDNKLILSTVLAFSCICGVQVQRSSPRITEPAEDRYEAPVGRPFSLQCVAPANIAVEWYFQQRKVWQGSMSEYTITERANYAANEKFSTLTTKQGASNTLAGEYRCQNEDDRSSFDSVLVILGSTSGGSSWGSSSSNSDSMGGYNRDSSSSSSSQGGSNYGGSSQSSVTITNPRGETLSVEEGYDMSIQCEGPRNSDLEWYVNDRQVNERQGSRYIITERVDYGTSKKISIISNRDPASSSLTGEYRCQDSDDRNSRDQVDVTVGRQANPWNMGGNGANNGYTASTTPGSGGYHSKPLVFSTIIFEPYLMENTDRNAVGNDRFVGFIPDLVQEIARRLDFEYELRLVKDNKWGARDQSTGQWNGMVGEVIRGEADCAAAPLVISNIRKLVVDLTDPFMDTNLAILLHKNSTVLSVKDLVNSNHSYGTLDMGWNKAIMMSSKKEPYSTMWSKMASSDPTWFVHNNEQGVMRVLEEEFGFILRKPMAEFYMLKDCRLYYVETSLGSEGYGFALPRNSAKLGEFNAMIRDMRRDGKIQEIQDRWWKASPCPYPLFASTASHIFTSFTIFICAALLHI